MLFGWMETDQTSLIDGFMHYRVVDVDVDVDV